MGAERGRRTGVVDLELQRAMDLSRREADEGRERGRAARGKAEEDEVRVRAQMAVEEEADPEELGPKNKVLVRRLKEALNHSEEKYVEFRR